MEPVNLKRMMERIGDFPTLPGIVAHVMQILENPYSSASDLTEIVSRDQSMMFRVLKMANSAYYGFPRAITTVTESIVLLGFSTFRNLVLTTMMYNFDQMWAAEAKQDFPGKSRLQEEWRHSVAAAIATRELQAGLHQAEATQTGYLAGLMHDIGKIFFFNYMSAEYRAVLARQEAEQGDLTAIEEEIVGAGHGQVGAWIVDRWNLPKEIVAPIAWHHAPGKAKDNGDLARMLNQADWMAHWALEKKPEEAPENPPENLDPEVLKTICQTVRQEIKNLESLMAV